MTHVCRHCGCTVELRDEGWAHAGELSPRRLRFWCRAGDARSALQLVEPLVSKPSLD